MITGDGKATYPAAFKNAGDPVASQRGRRYPSSRRGKGAKMTITRAIVLTVLLLAGLLLPAAGPASAAEQPRLSRYSGPPPVVGPHPPIWRYNGPPQEMPFARSERSQSIWASGTCWSECGAYCAWNLNACLYNDTQGNCILQSAACDRACQRSCRSQGGPFLPIE